MSISASMDIYQLSIHIFCKINIFNTKAQNNYNLLDKLAD